MISNEKQILELREQFVTKLKEMESDLFHPSDILRVKTDDHYLKRFLLHNDCNPESAFNMLWDTCEWRKKIGANDISEKSVNPNILELGSIFSHGKDKDGRTLLIFKSKKHVKGEFDFEDHKKCLIYWMERMERQENGEMISLFFDLDGAALANMDMEYTSYLISLFKNYYPYFLNYIIIFEMAWVLSALFRVIKSWLPPKAIDKMKFVNKSNVKKFIEPQYILKSWGGKDEFVYQFEPEQKNIILSGEDNKKKVHFADAAFKEGQLNESGFEESSPATNKISSSRLKISPSDIMIFSQEKNEVISSIILTNEDSKCISFKIKTNSPEKFRVRPSAGVLASRASSTISVQLLPGYLVQTLQRDKFLIITLPIENTDISQQEINDMWKHVNDRDTHQYRLRCTMNQTAANDICFKNSPSVNALTQEEQKLSPKFNSDITKLNFCIGELKEEIKIIRQQQWIIVFGMILLMCSVSYVIYNGHVKSFPLKQNC